ncbi:E3 ubiquitin-protein ligase EL5 [Brachypodium distachyon]|uniref:RING-type domain-containing protein n=1 Tax=Brachypodium distachyon TaxID=15368 RepID=A0A0Q3FQ13_BRADI|nr:E3 ubiquitin-protein ligase EL5 [Brachypodium distachyon]KQK01488.1 hypothetical protein BRADI_3g56160v3 [Brachypodium distachyon]|eukprot:XP_003572979.2 E3 ubiquitin-protein ligase EL5 [Brachypodium distachyon]
MRAREVAAGLIAHAIPGAATMATGIIPTVLLAAGVTLMVLVHILVIFWALRRGFIERRLSRVRVGEGGQDAEEAGAGLTEEEVGELPCHDFKPDQLAAGEGGAGECAVCLEALRDGERCAVLPRCGHGFHAECVGSWLRKSRLCPVCRAEVVAGSPRKEAGAMAAEVV